MNLLNESPLPNESPLLNESQLPNVRRAIVTCDAMVACPSPPRQPRWSLLRTLRSSGAITLLCVMLLGLYPSAGQATTTVTTTFAVTATVQATCLVSATAMAFGIYTGVAATATSAVTVTCTNTTPYNVGLNVGLASGATVTTRMMTGPSSALLSYALYSDSSRTVNWGQTIGTDTVTGTGNGAAQAITVYGKVPAGQYVTPGSFTDTITATVTY